MEPVTEEHIIEGIHQATKDGGTLGLFPPVQSVEQDAVCCAAVINIMRQQMPNVMLPDWKTGVEVVEGTPVCWQPIQCLECQGQTYYDLMQYRHRCVECGAGF